MDEKMRRRRFDVAFKAEAIAMLNSGMSQSEVARQLGFRTQRLSQWKKQLAEHGSLERAFPGNGVERDGRFHENVTRDAELVKLRRELAEVRRERDILKKAVLTFTRPHKTPKL